MPANRMTKTLDSEKIDWALRSLIQNYVVVVESTAQVSFFSLLPALALYWKGIVWEVSFVFLAPIVLVVRLLGFVLFRRTKAREWGYTIIQKATEPFVALHHGEMSAVKLLTLRGVVRLLLYRRLSSNLSLLILRLQEAKARHFMERSTSPFDLKWFEERIALLKDVKATSGEKLGFAFWSSLVSAATVFGVVKAVVEYVPDSTKTLILENIRNLPVISSVADSIHSANIHGPVATLIFGVLTYTLWIVITNFIVMRSLLASQSTYKVESDAFKAMDMKAPVEFPFDLAGFIVVSIIMICTVAYVAPTSEPIRDGLFVTLLYLLIPSYALVRRYMCGKKLKAQAPTQARADQAHP